MGDSITNQNLIKQNVLEKLDWSFIQSELASRARTLSGIETCMALAPTLDRETIQNRWEQVLPLKDLIKSGYVPPLSEIAILDPVFRAICVGQTLNGKELRQVYDLLVCIKHLHKFAKDFGARCLPLKQFHTRTYPLPRLIQEIESTIDVSGELFDEASTELLAVRRSKINLHKKIEGILRTMFEDVELRKYLQDDFFTIRAERYVVPIRLDGRGRIKGSIYDTSNSGQTLFIEPTAIAPLNEQLLELELSEKLEILRIFRHLGTLLKSELEILTTNYQEIVKLDTLSAEALLAHSLNAQAVVLTETPRLNLQAARHPALMLRKDSSVIANHIVLRPEQRGLIISGPNAGGKTVVLKTAGIIMLMLKAGLLIPAEEHSELYCFEQIFLELGDTQSLSQNLSTFSGHLAGLRPIVEQSNETTLVLLDELAAGTEPADGSALAQATLEYLQTKGATLLVTTHYDRLKALAVEHSYFRNGSMEYSLSTLRPTYRLVLDIPGQSHGIELAQNLGLASTLIERAQKLRGESVNQLESVVSALSEQRANLTRLTEETERKTLATEAEKNHWQREREQLAALRRSMRENLLEQFSDEFFSQRQELESFIKAFRKLKHPAEASEEEVDRAREAIRQHEKTLKNEAKNLGKSSDAHLNYRIPSPEELLPGKIVIVRGLNQKARVVKVIGSPPDIKVEVMINQISMRVNISDLGL